jgi:hypothetical protein
MDMYKNHFSTVGSVFLYYAIMELVKSENKWSLCRNDCNARETPSQKINPHGAHGRSRPAGENGAIDHGSQGRLAHYLLPLFSFERIVPAPCTKPYQTVETSTTQQENIGFVRIIFFDNR